MKAMILAAGRGERLRPLTERVPKPMLPIGGEPLIVHQIRWLHRAGIRDVVINLHHLGEQIEDALGRGADLGVRIRYSPEPDLLDTGGGIKKALPLLLPGPFVILNGDIWTDYSFENLPFENLPFENLPFENLPGVRTGKAHLVLTPTPPHKPHADFHLRMEAGVAKVRRGPGDDLTYCGIAVIDAALFDGAPDGPFSLSELLFGAAAVGDLEGEVFEGTWIDIGTPEELKRARRLMA